MRKTGFPVQKPRDCVECDPVAGFLAGCMSGQQQGKGGDGSNVVGGVALQTHRFDMGWRDRDRPGTGEAASVGTDGGVGTRRVCDIVCSSFLASWEGR